MDDLQDMLSWIESSSDDEEEEFGSDKEMATDAQDQFEAMLAAEQVIMMNLKDCSAQSTASWELA